MQVHLLLGPAGSGKTFRCLAEIRQALSASPDGPALILLAPKQTTYQLERQLLADPSLPGYTRLQILSFERLAHFVFAQLQKPSPPMLNEEGRVMVLRSLLAKKRDQLKLFRASARLTGFAQELSGVLSELQRHQLTPEMLKDIAERVHHVAGLAFKLHDFATLLQNYLDWLKEQQLLDTDCLLPAITQVLRERGEQNSKLSIERLWVDGFAEWSAQELDLLAALMPSCDQATITFCLDREPTEKISWLSTWSPIRRAFEACKQRLEDSSAANLSVELMASDPTKTRFLSPVLRHLERFWPEPRPYESAAVPAEQPGSRVNDAVGAKSANLSVQFEWLWPEHGQAAQPVSAKGSPNKRKLVERVPVGKAAEVRLPGPFDPGRGYLFSGVRPSSGAATSETQLVSSESSAANPIETAAPEDGRIPLKVAICVDPEAEATLAAREILRHVRAGGRFREVTVLVRKLEDYHEILQRVFTRYDIPFFMDRRESVAHHPLAELTRSAVRTVAMQWKHEEWFAALKTGLVPADETEIDRLENEALARGWKGAAWHSPINLVALSPHLRVPGRNELGEGGRGGRGPENISEQAKSAAEQQEWRRLEARLEELRQRIVPPFERLALALAAGKPTGPQLATALREFWKTLKIEQRLLQSSDLDAPTLHAPTLHAPRSTAIHATVWEQMNQWLDNVEIAFSTEALSLREWLPIIEAGLANLTVGVIPPALDQVLIGAIDRSRNPEIKLALVLGLNETVFPAPPQSTILLTETDRAELERQNVMLGATSRQQLGRERFLAYIAFTRARERLLLTSALQDANGGPLNPSPFLSQLKQLFPSLQFEMVPRTLDWRDSEHESELVGEILKVRSQDAGTGSQETAHLKSTTPQPPDPGPTAIELSNLPSEAAMSSPSPPLEERAGERRPFARAPLISTAVHPGPLPLAGGEGGSQFALARSADHPLHRRGGEGRGEGAMAVLPGCARPETDTQGWEKLARLPKLAKVIERVRHFPNPDFEDSLAPELAVGLYGPVLHSSVSRLEQFAACPFKFFVHSGLKAEERKLFELDVREQGSFQHDVLALFHQQLRQENKRWRDITPQEARSRIARIANALVVSYHDGLLQATEQSRFKARLLTESLQDFVETLVGWMGRQYQFDPVEVELPFGESESSPAWQIDLDRGLRLAINGRIDRIDLCRSANGAEALCVVVDYKSSQKQLDPLLMAHGLQLQLLTYLNVIRYWPQPRELFGVERLIPAGVFYVNLRGKYQRAQNRAEALAEADTVRRLAYRHLGRFDVRTLRRLDARADALEGDQFNYRLTRNGEINKSCRDALAPAQFEAMLDAVEAHLKTMGRQIFSGASGVSPYRKGSTTACEQCDYQSICRIDPWTHRYRVLRKPEEETH